MSGDLSLVSETQHIVVDPHTQTISVVLAGPVGPPGPAGADGVLTQETLDSALTDKVDKAGDTLTGHLISPSVSGVEGDNVLATIGYVDWSATSVRNAVGKSTISETAPSDPQPADIWVDPEDFNVYMFYVEPTESVGQWVQIASITETYNSEPQGTSVATVTAHNTDGTAHQDIRNAIGAYVLDTGDTMTGELKIKYTWAALKLAADNAGYVDFANSSDVVRLNLSYNNLDGNFYITQRDESGVYVRHPLYINSDGEVIFSVPPSMPDNTDFGQMAKLTGFDQLTNQVQVAGQEVGSSNWYIYSNVDLDNGWTVTDFRVRRLGNIVEIKIEGLDGTNATGIQCITLDSAFRPPETVRGGLHTLDSEFIRGYISAAGVMAHNDPGTLSKVYYGHYMYSVENSYSLLVGL